MTDWGLWSYQVMLFERSSDGNFSPSASYRPDALVTFATHDLPTFAGWLAGTDLDLRRDLNIPAGETRGQRKEARAALRRAVGVSGTRPTEFIGVAKFLAGTSSRLLMVSVEDLLGLADQVNVPGTTNEHPNWRQRWPIALEQLAERADVCALGNAMRAAGRASG
jgi:4-alpha-glucanotransferase